MANIPFASEGYARRWRERAARIEREVLEKVRRRERVSTNVEAIHQERLTLGERLADRMADVAGSWNFILAFGVVLGAWVFVNSVAFVSHWDKYPYILLNLMLSMLAAIQAPVIMMSQNRQEARDRLRSEHDYEINLKAEIEVQQIIEKLSEIQVMLSGAAKREPS
jgi:uncharacterized membrane protein